VVGERLVVERGNLDVPGRTVKADGLSKAAVGLQPHSGRSALGGGRLELGK